MPTTTRVIVVACPIRIRKGCHRGIIRRRTSVSQTCDDRRCARPGPPGICRVRHELHRSIRSTSTPAVMMWLLTGGQEWASSGGLRVIPMMPGNLPGRHASPCDMLLQVASYEHDDTCQPGVSAPRTSHPAPWRPLFRLTRFGARTEAHPLLHAAFHEPTTPNQEMDTWNAA